MRAREFYMKDCYSFHAAEEDAEAFYKKAFDAYVKIFERCDFKFRAVDADSGAIGGSFSHEFMVLADTGEDEIISCNACGYGANREKHGTGTACPKCSMAETIRESPLQVSRGIEVGHCFKLGTKYSDAMKAMFLDDKGIHKPFIMGCYGIGISRIVAASIEQGHDENGIIWTKSLAPYQVVIIPTNYTEPKIKEWADKFYTEVHKLGVDAVLDDRDCRAGVKFKDADLIGYPLRITLGEKGLARGIAEVKPRSEKDFKEISLENVLGEVRNFFAQ